MEGRERTTKLALLLVCGSSQELQDVFVCARENVVQEKKRQNRCSMSTMIITTVYSNVIINFVYFISFIERQLVL